jgi:hypothetical protein
VEDAPKNLIANHHPSRRTQEWLWFRRPISVLAKIGTGKLEQHSSSKVLFLVVSSLSREQEE